ncbi:MAG: hypothetical protein KatS3mg060_0842 [Dehalococcoidia bacterium]|nr:MAG: hypothetical protein KatS3mg060_0842 [Dehalococcoidia bacterium]
MDEMFVPDVTKEVPAVTEEERSVELADRLGPDATRTLIAAVVRDMLADEQREVWRRRRERLLQYLNVVEYNLDYDLRARGLADKRTR